MTSPPTAGQVKALLEAKGWTAQKRFGQNFLIDANLCRFLTDQVGEGAVVEIGPGLGHLTFALLEKGMCVQAIEIDRGYCVRLREIFQEESRFSLIEGDVMDLIPRLEGVSAIVSNLPYNISGPLLASLSLLEKPPKRIVMTLQKEMADRLLASPSTPAYGALTVQIQSTWQVVPLRQIPPEAFWPRPSIVSTAVQMELRPDCLGVASRKKLSGLVRTGFSARRKMLTGTLSQMGFARQVIRDALTHGGLSPDARPEHLSPQDWRDLAGRLEVATPS